MDAIKTISSTNQNNFERACNELAEEGYIMQSSYCGLYDGQASGENIYPLWLAIFALPEFGQTHTPPQRQ